jgi:hypothetical protein
MEEVARLNVLATALEERVLNSLQLQLLFCKGITQLIMNAMEGNSHGILTKSSRIHHRPELRLSVRGCSPDPGDTFMQAIAIDTYVLEVPYTV